MRTVRTQIYLSEGVHRQLKDRGRKLQRSLADQVREAVALYLEQPDGLPVEDPLWSIAGQYDSGETNVSANHDDILYGKKRE